MIRILIRYLILIAFICYPATNLLAQRPASGFKPGKEEKKKDGPESPQEREDRMRKEAAGKSKESAKEDKKRDPDKPLTKRQRAKKLRKDEKEKKAAYYAHQNRIQEPRVRYRMNKNEKKAKRYNDRKNAPWWRKFQFNHSKKKVRR